MTDSTFPGGIFRDCLFERKVAIVTGGGTGIGFVIAAMLARLGASVVISGRRSEPLDAAVKHIVDRGGQAHAVAMSIRDQANVDLLFDVAWERYGGLDILVNNAGGQFTQPAIDISANGWRAVIDTNLNGTWNMMQTAARRWRSAARPGIIVNIVLGITRGIPGMAHSAAARAGVITMSKTVAVEWAAAGIRVNCLAPGIIDSSGLANYDADVRETALASNPMHRLGTVAEVAQGCIFLCSPAAGFMSGEVLTMDGGQQLWGETWTVAKAAGLRNG